MNIPVLCTGNTARSILPESILNQDSNGCIRACCAGATSSGRVHQQSLTQPAAEHYPNDGLSSQCLDAQDDALKMALPFETLERGDLKTALSRMADP